jgi:tetratricopeptide (TPR) repeat protein
MVFSAIALKLSDSPQLKRISPNLGIMLVSGAVFCMALFSVINNSVWKNNFSMGSFWARTFPDFYKGHVMYGEALFDHGLYPEALSHFESALDDPRFYDPDGLYYLVRTYLKLGRDQDAGRLNDAIMVEYPWYARGHFVRAQLAFKKKDYLKAKQEAYQALKQGAEQEDFFFLLNLADQSAEERLVDDVVREAHARISDPAVMKAVEKIADNIRLKNKGKASPGNP